MQNNQENPLNLDAVEILFNRNNSANEALMLKMRAVIEALMEQVKARDAEIQQLQGVAKTDKKPQDARK